MEELGKFHQKIPDPVKRERSWEDITKGVESRYFPDAVKRFDKLLADMEIELSKGPWLAGIQFSLADIGYAPLHPATGSSSTSVFVGQTAVRCSMVRAGSGAARLQGRYRRSDRCFLPTSHERKGCRSPLAGEDDRRFGLMTSRRCQEPWLRLTALSRPLQNTAAQLSVRLYCDSVELHLSDCGGALRKIQFLNRTR